MATATQVAPNCCENLVRQDQDFFILFYTIEKHHYQRKILIFHLNHQNKKSRDWLHRSLDWQNCKVDRDPEIIHQIVHTHRLLFCCHTSSNSLITTLAHSLTSHPYWYNHIITKRMSQSRGQKLFFVNGNIYINFCCPIAGTKKCSQKDLETIIPVAKHPVLIWKTLFNFLCLLGLPGWFVWL